MIPLVEVRAAPWAFDLPIRAFAGCPTAALLAFAVLAVPVLAALFLPKPRGGWLIAVWFALAAWFLRDRLQLLGDSRLWIHSAEAFGDRVPHFHAPLAAKILGWMGGMSGKEGVAPALAAVSVVAGLLTWVAMAWGFRDSPEGDEGRTPIARLLPILLFAAPASFIFYGHIESYPLLAAALAALLASLRRDFDRGRPGPATGVLLVVLAFTHVLGLLILLPLAVALWGRARGPKAWLAAYIALAAAAIVAALFVPSFRTRALLAQGWSAKELVTYLADVANGWFLLAVPGAFLAVRTRAWRNPYGRFLALVFLTYALFPVVAVFELGIYRDLDLFAPAFVSLAFLAGHGIARHRAPSRRELAGWFGAGAVLLASVLTLGRCPEGTKAIERQLRHAAMTPAGRSYGWEILSFAAWQERDTKEAESRMLAAIAVVPGNQRLYGPLGIIQLARSDTVAAIESLTRSMATARAPESAPLLAELLTRTGNPEGAIRILAPRREALLGNRQAAAALAVAYFRVGLPESTIAVARERLVRDPADDVAYVNKASGLAALGRNEEAAAALREAARLAPENLEVHRRLVRTLLLLPDGRAQIEAYLHELRPALVESVLTGD